MTAVIDDLHAALCIAALLLWIPSPILETLGASDHQYTFVHISRMCLVLFPVPRLEKTQGLIHLLLPTVLKIKF